MLTARESFWPIMLCSGWSPCAGARGIRSGPSAARQVVSSYGTQHPASPGLGRPPPNGLLLCAAVDGDPVPVPHWGLALRVDQFHALAERVRASGISFEIEPHLRFKGARRPHRQVLVTGRP